MTGPEEHPERSRPKELDPVPETVVKRAREAFSERTPGQLAQLVSDSLLDGGDPAEAHRLTFEGGGARIEVDVAVGQGRSTLQGTVDQMATARAMLHLEATELAVVAGVSGGTFSFEDVPHGVVRLSFTLVAGSSVFTDWFRV